MTPTGTSAACAHTLWQPNKKQQVPVLQVGSAQPTVSGTNQLKNATLVRGYPEQQTAHERCHQDKRKQITTSLQSHHNLISPALLRNKLQTGPAEEERVQLHCDLFPQTNPAISNCCMSHILAFLHNILLLLFTSSVAHDHNPFSH